MAILDTHSVKLSSDLTIFLSTSYVGISLHLYLNKSPYWLAWMFKFIVYFLSEHIKINMVFLSKRIYRINDWVDEKKAFLAATSGEIVEWSMLIMIWWWDNERIDRGGLYIIPGVINFKPWEKIEIFLVICYNFMWVVLFIFCNKNFLKVSVPEFGTASNVIGWKR